MFAYRDHRDRRAAGFTRAHLIRRERAAASEPGERSGAGHGAPASKPVGESEGRRPSDETAHLIGRDRAAASGPGERSGAWGPREQASRGVRGATPLG